MFRTVVTVLLTALVCFVASVLVTMNGVAVDCTINRCECPQVKGCECAKAQPCACKSDCCKETTSAQKRTADCKCGKRVEGAWHFDCECGLGKECTCKAPKKTGCADGEDLGFDLLLLDDKGAVLGFLRAGEQLRWQMCRQDFDTMFGVVHVEPLEPKEQKPGAAALATQRTK